MYMMMKRHLNFFLDVDADWADWLQGLENGGFGEEHLRFNDVCVEGEHVFEDDSKRKRLPIRFDLRMLDPMREIVERKTEEKKVINSS